MVRHSRGRYTERQLDRCSKLSGAFGHEVGRLMQHVGGRHGRVASRRGSSSDVRHFVTELLPDALLAYVPGREVQGIDIPQKSRSLRSPDKMGLRLRELSREKDFWAVMED